MAPRILLGLALVAAVTVGAVMQSQACTSLRVKSTEGHVFYARTMEFSTSDQPQVAVMPKGTVMRGTLPDGRQEGATWTSKYGFVGMRDYGPPLVSDGMNEKGLVTNLLWLVESNYPTFNKEGKIIIPVSYSACYPFYKDKAIVSQNFKFVIIDKNANPLTESLSYEEMKNYLESQQLQIMFDDFRFMNRKN